MKTEQYSVSAGQLVYDYGSMVSAICRRMMQDEESACEAAQEIWLEVMKSLPSFQGRSKLSTWIYTIAYRIAIRYAKKEKIYSTKFLRDYFRSGERDFPDDCNIDKKIWVKEMCGKCLTGILHCLNNEARIAYIFRDIVELPYEEISQILRKESSSVRQLISRSRRKLKHFLDNECALHNPNGTCACRMKKLVIEMDLPQEYKKLRKIVARANVFKEAEQVLPRKNYWEIRIAEKKFLAETTTCKLCAIAKKINAPAPCYLYCLDPMEGMVKGLNPHATFAVEETLWDGEKCRVLVNDNAG